MSLDDEPWASTHDIASTPAASMLGLLFPKGSRVAGAQTSQGEAPDAPATQLLSKFAHPVPRALPAHRLLGCQETPVACFGSTASVGHRHRNGDS